ncbi:DNA polymerase III subunit beta [Paludibacter sp. 221]|uniref:DNA polymerase III subunit beta n=1 Tax=Paludibacter sp. 221 TaxID=2302939 RepID=UPI0013D83A67|nr:DNA polymerase III subunit beta [Paludibacter sp. 221]NDV47740.1 DNA polymerase III subunit beta [Paludibacter sp. 221]
MKFIASSTALSSHLQAISRVINSKNSLPILDNFLFELNGNTLTMTASDIETTLVTSMEVESAEGSGKVAVTSKLLLDTLREFSEQPLSFDINDSNLALVITSSNGSYNFIGQNGDEYPRLPEMQGDARSLNIPVETLSTGIVKALFATADDELRPVMNGVFFDIDAEGLTLVATDAHKLVRYKTKYASASVQGDERESFILPKKPATMLKNILPKESGDVAIEFDNKNARFKLENYTMVCRQVEGRFPNYNGVIPKENPYKVIVDRVSIMNALKRVSVFANQGSNLVKLAFSANQIHVSAQDIDFSISAEETINCQYEGDKINIGFKSSFLIEILNNIDSADVIFELADPSRAGLILPFENEENEEVLMLLMPMLLSE